MKHENVLQKWRERRKQVVAWRADGRSLKSIARQLGITYQRVQQIVHREKENAQKARID